MIKNNALYKNYQRTFSLIEKSYHKNANTHLKDQINVRIDKIDRLINKLIMTTQHNQNNTLKAKIEKIIEFRTEIKSLTEDLDEPLLLAMIGTGNYGKSTLLNALLGQEVAETNWLPKTWKVDIFYNSNENIATIHYKNGKIKKDSSDQIKKILADEERKRKNSEKLVKENLKKMIKNIKNTTEKKAIERELEDKFLYKSPISKVEWPVNSSDLLNDFKLVDTPGLFQKLLGEVKKSISDYYSQAEGIIWLLDATSISAKQSRKMLDDLNKSLDKIGGKPDNMIAVINKIDLVRKNNDSNVETVIDEAKRIFGDIFDDIIPISAKEAIEGIKKDDSELIMRSGIMNLHMKIKERFLTKAHTIKINKKIQDYKLALNSLVDILDNYSLELSTANKQREKLKDSFNRESNDILSQNIDLIKSNLAIYKENVLNNIENNTEKIFELEEDQIKNYVKKAIFQKDDLSKLIKSVETDISLSIGKIEKFHSKKAMFKKYKYINAKKFGLNKKYSFNNIETKNYAADLEGTYTFGVGVTVVAGILLGPMGLVLGGIANYFGLSKFINKMTKLPKVKNKLKNHLETSVAEVESTLIEQLSNNIKNVEKRISTIRDQSFSELHCNHGDIQRVLMIFDVIQALKYKDFNELKVIDIIRSN